MLKAVAHGCIARLLQIAGKDAKLAEEVVMLLVPHGEFYKDFLWIPGSQEAEGERRPSSLGRMLCTSPWLPTHNGASVPLHMAWLCGSPNQAEKRFAFLPCVSALAEAWSSLGIEQSPSAETIISILRSLRAHKGDILRTSEMMTIYDKIQDKPTKRPALSVSAFINQDDDLDAFLNEESWVFIPNHPKPHGGFQSWYDKRSQRPHPGDFYRVNQLVLQDPAECLDGFSQNAEDAAIDLMRECLDKRVVANYYFGSQTLFPASWSSGIPTNRFLDFLGTRGVQDQLRIEDYLAVLEAVDGQILISKRAEPKISLESIPGLMRQILGRVHRLVEFEMQESRDRQEDEEEQEGESPKPPKTITSNILAKFRQEASNLRFLMAADGSWQPMRHFVYAADEKKTAEFSGWSDGTLQYVAVVPSKGRESARRIITLLKRCGIRPSEEKEETLRRCAAIVPCEEVLQEQRRTLTSQILSEAIHTAESAIKVKENVTDATGIFDRIRDLVGRFRVEPASEMSVYQAIALDIREIRTRGRKEPGAGELSTQFAEFKPQKGAAIPIARTKQLGSTPLAFTGEAPAGTEDEEKQIVFTFQGGVVEALEEGSQSLSRALVLVAAQGSRGDLDKGGGHKGKRGLSELENGIANLLAMAIGAAAEAAEQGQDEPSESFSKPVSESMEAEGLSNPEDTASTGRLLTKLLEQFKDVENADMWDALAHASDEADQEGSGVEMDLSTADLLENAYEALHFRQRRRAKKTQGGSLSSQEVPGKSARRNQELGELPPSLDELLPPMLPYDTQSSGSNANIPVDAAAGQGRSEQRDRLQDANGRKREVSAEVGPAKQVDRLRDDEDRLSRRERGLSYPRGYSLKRIALDLNAPPLETGTFGDADVRPEDLQEVLAKAPMPSSDSGAGSSQGLEWVGKVGEQLAARSLEQQGFEVCWVNENGELGLPFDLILSQGGSLPTLRSDERSVQGELAAELLDAALHGKGDPNVCFVEVKSTTSGDREVFEISRAEVSALSTLGPRYWLARVFGVPNANPQSHKAQKTKVRLWKDPNKALQSGEMKLLLLT